MKRLQEESASPKLHGKSVKVEEKKDDCGPLGRKFHQAVLHILS